MPIDMEFDGQQLRWKGTCKYRATSGLPDYQVPENQCLKDKGPIPEGLYKVLVSDRGAAKMMVPDAAICLEDGGSKPFRKEQAPALANPTGQIGGVTGQPWNRQMSKREMPAHRTAAASICTVRPKALAMDASKLNHGYLLPCAPVRPLA